MKKCLIYFLLSPIAVSAQVHYAGSVDSSFGNNGITSIATAAISDIIITSSDSIVAVGSDTQARPTTLRFSKNGILDPSYGTQGLASIYIKGRVNRFLISIAQQSDGKFITGGGSEDSASAVAREDFLIVRQNYDGSLDTSFNHVGYAIADFYHGFDYVSSIAIQQDGKIIAGGTVGNDNFGMVRINTNGTTDSSFCNCGTGLEMPSIVGSLGITGSAIVLQPDGKILVGGNANLYSINVFLLMRFNANGTLDSSFGTNGITLTNFSNTYDAINALSLLPDGKILAAGTVGIYGGAFGIARYMSNGTLDSSFGGSGLTATVVDSTTNNIATCMGIEPDGKIVLAGRSFNSSVYMLSVARYIPNGVIDSSFGTNGITYRQIGSQDDIKALQIQKNGKIVVGGSIQTTNAVSDGLLVRFQAVNNMSVPVIVSTNESFSIYPNPAQNHIIIKSSIVLDKGSLQIFDLNGKFVQGEELQFENGEAKVHTELIPGMYAAQLVDKKNGRIHTIKLSIAQ